MNNNNNNNAPGGVDLIISSERNITFLKDWIDRRMAPGHFLLNYGEDTYFEIIKNGDKYTVKKLTEENELLEEMTIRPNELLNFIRDNATFLKGGKRRSVRQKRTQRKRKASRRRRN